MRLKPLNWVFSLRLRTLRLCRDGKLVTHSHSYPKSLGLGESASNSALFSSTPILYVFFHSFSITLKTVKISNTFTPGSGYPVVLLLVCNETKRPKPQDKCTGQGWQDRDPTEKHRCADFTRNQVPTSQVESRRRLQFSSFTYHSDSWTPKAGASAVTSEPRVLKNESWKFRNAPLELCGSGGNHEATNLHCLTVKFMLQKN